MRYYPASQAVLPQGLTVLPQRTAVLPWPQQELAQACSNEVGAVLPLARYYRNPLRYYRKAGLDQPGKAVDR